MRRVFGVVDYVVLVLVGLTLPIVFFGGVRFGMNVEAHNAAMVAVEPEGQRDGRCYGDVWIVAPGDNPWTIAQACFPGEHTGQRAHEITQLNGVDAGSLREGMRLHLPERGR